jgi:hypothetical protein
VLVREDHLNLTGTIQHLGMLLEFAPTRQGADGNRAEWEWSREMFLSIRLRE